MLYTYKGTTDSQYFMDILLKTSNETDAIAYMHLVLGILSEPEVGCTAKQDDTFRTMLSSKPGCIEYVLNACLHGGTFKTHEVLLVMYCVFVFRFQNISFKNCTQSIWKALCAYFSDDNVRQIQLLRSTPTNLTFQISGFVGGIWHELNTIHNHLIRNENGLLLRFQVNPGQTLTVSNGNLNWGQAEELV